MDDNTMKLFGTKVVQGIVDIKCDICGKTCNDGINYQHATLSAEWGYGSTKDGTRWDADFCESCSDQLKTVIENIGGRINKTDYT